MLLYLPRSLMLAFIGQFLWSNRTSFAYFKASSQVFAKSFSSRSKKGLQLAIIDCKLQLLELAIVVMGFLSSESYVDFSTYWFNCINNSSYQTCIVFEKIFLAPLKNNHVMSQVYVKINGIVSTLTT